MKLPHNQVKTYQQELSRQKVYFPPAKVKEWLIKCELNQIPHA